jgi:GH15 family glucan-1,4-alpha-glucosidase
MAPPFNDPPADLPTALDTTYQALLRPNGGVVPGNDPDFDWGNVTWTPSTSFFALAWAGLAERGKAQAALDWVLSKRNNLGELPELVDGNGNPASTVPLAWTGSLLILTLVQLQDHSIKTPPPATAQ